MTFTGYTEQQLVPQSSGVTLGGLQDHNLARRIQLVQRAAPIFSQGDGAAYALKLAQNQEWDDNALIRNAQVAGGELLVGSYKQHLLSIEDPWKQLQAFKQFDKGQQRLLTEAGYIPPEAQDPGPKGFGIVTSILGDAVSTAFNLTGIKQGLEGLNYLAGLGTHAYRAARLGIEEEGLFGTSFGRQQDYDPEVAKRRKNILTDFRYLWSATEDGESTFSVKARERTELAIPEQDKYEFVLAMAEGKDIYEYLTEDLEIDPNSPVFRDQLLRYSQYQTQDDVNSAIADLRNNKFSPGRDFASMIGADRGTTAFNIISGGIDATFRIVTDPTLVGGKVLKGYRLSRYGISPRLLEMGDDAVDLAQRVDYLATVPRFRRAADEIAMGFREGTEAQLLDKMPQLRGGGLNDLNSYVLKEGIPREEITAETVFGYFKSNAGTAALRDGKFVAPHFPGTILPSLSKPEAFKANLAIGAKGWVQGFRLEDYGFDALEPEQLKALFGLRGKTAIDMRSAVGDAIHSFYTRVPKYDFMSPDDSNSLEQFRAVLDYSMPAFMRDDFVNEFMRTTDVATRKSIYEAGVTSMFHYSGALATDEGKKLLNKALRRGQVFGRDGVDLLDNKPTGIGEADLAEYWGLPDFKDMLKATAETTRYRHFLDSTNEGLINRFFANYWKPAVLLKAGFIPRAYGEEYLGFILREGPTAWVKSQAAITATKEGYLLPLRPVGWIADSLLSHIPLTSKANTLDIYAHNIAGSTSNFVRTWAGKLAPDDYLAAAKSLADNGGMNAAGRDLGTAFGEVAPPEGMRVKNETIGRIDENTGDIVQIPIKHGEFTTHVKGSGFHAHAVLREMRRMQTDRLFAPLVDAGRRQFGRDEALGIVNQFADAGLIEVADTSLNYTVYLRKLRQLVPNKVMPKFESFLKNNAHASRQSVIDDLVENGVEVDVADAIYDNIRNLSPRQRVAIFTRDGELERLYQPQVLDPDSAFDFDSPLPFLRQEVENKALREYHEVLDTIWGEGVSGDAYQRIAYRRLTAGDMHDTVRKSFRSRMTLDRRTVAAPPIRGTRRMYTLMVDNSFDDLGDIGGVSTRYTSKPRLRGQGQVLDAENGYIPIEASEVNSLIPDHTPRVDLQDLPGGEQLTPEEMAWFTEDFAHAQQLQDTLMGKYRGQRMRIGYVDVPEDVYLQGRNAAKANAAGGVDPLALANQTNQVWIPKSWRESFQVLDDEVRMVSREVEDAEEALRDLTFRMSESYGKAGPNWKVYLQPEDKALVEAAEAKVADLKAKLEAGELKADAAVGASRDDALRDWASVISQRYGQVFESKDALGLRDFQHNLVDGRVNVNDVVDNGQFLADAAIGPAALEPTRDSWFKQITNKGFDVVGKGGNAMIRNQMFLHYYAQRLGAETRRIARVVGNTQAADTIEEFAERLGTQHYKLAQDWKSLPDDVRNAANPYEAMIARDPVPPSLRSVVDPEDQKTFAEAWTAFYEHDNPDLLAEAERLWNTKYVRELGVDDYSFQDLQNSYLGLDEELRHSILGNGYPPQIPDAFVKADLDADEWTVLRDALETNKFAYKTAHDVAMRAAINDTIPWIDDHRIRSQFQQHGRNLIPFWFSQENFIKRVANNVWRDPASIRKAQVAMHALQNSGFVTQNQYGEDVFNIPLTGALTKGVMKAMDLLPGDSKWSLPVVNAMTGQVKYTIPGLDSFDRIGPSLSPLGALPLQGVVKLFPELEGAKNAIIGERGITNDSGFDMVMRSLVPSYAYKMFEAVSKDIESDTEYASAMIQTAQMLEVNGHGLPEDADPYQVDEYMERLENFTRMQMFVRGIVGFFSPAAPSTAPVEEFTPEFNDLLKKMPIEEAMMQYMAEHPNARAYTIVKTETPSKAPLSASEEAGRILDQHSDFFDRNPLAGAWLLPQSKDDTGFSNKTYNTQLAREMRQRKTLKEWYDDYYFAAAADDYFASKESYEMKMEAAKGNTQLRQQYTDSYQAWKDDYLNQHKIFARLLVDPTAQVRRQQVLDEIGTALDDPDAPDVQHKDSLRTLVTNFKDFQASRSQFRRNTTAERQARQSMTDRFSLWVRQYVDMNPGVKAFYDRIIRPEMEN